MGDRRCREVARAARSRGEVAVHRVPGTEGDPSRQPRVQLVAGVRVVKVGMVGERLGV